MKDICNEAGLSPGAVYNYFKGKEDIVARCAELSLQRNRAMYDSVSGKGVIYAFKAVLTMLFSTLKQENIREILSFDIELWAESTRNPAVHGPLKVNEDATLMMLQKMVAAGKKEGIFNPDIDDAAIARMLFSLFAGFELQMATDSTADADAYLAAMFSFLEGTLVNDTHKQETE